MPDTTHIPGQTGLPPETGNYYIDSLVRAMYQEQPASQPDDGPQYLLTEWEMFMVVMVIVYLLILRPLIKDLRATKSKQAKPEEWKPAITTLQQDHWLEKYNPYYASLSATAKQKFLSRVNHFMDAKQFHFHSMVAEPYIPVLISGAAVQLTYGLPNYLMDYFDSIHVMRKEYVLNIDKETYYGHVSKQGVHISWNHFLEGYHDYTDSINVGLHEMAHALQFDSVLGFEDTHDRSFKRRLNEFANEGRPVFAAMRQGASHLLSEYAATNFDEFWAVSVETFFGKPAEFSAKLPNLYREMTELLNQDPLQPDKVLCVGKDIL